MANAIILDPFTLNNIAANSFRIMEIQQKFDSLKKNILENYKKMYKIKNINNISYNNYDNFNNKGKYKNKDNYNFQFKLFKSLSTKELVNTEDSFEYDYTNIKTKGNFCGSKLTFEEYEKENDMYNNDISPNFLELSIK